MGHGTKSRPYLHTSGRCIISVTMQPLPLAWSITVFAELIENPITSVRCSMLLAVLSGMEASERCGAFPMFWVAVY